MGIIQETMMVMVDTTNNNNKFYHVTLDDNDVVTKTWGRVGNSGQVQTEATGLRGYQRVLAQREKKGYKPVSVVGSVTPTLGANSQQNNKLETVAKKFLTKSDDDVILKLIERLVAANAHQIMAASGGMIKVTDDGQIRTALGLVDDTTIRNAENILTNLRRQTKNSRQQISLLEDYLTLIPQKVGSRRGWHEDYLEDKNLLGQFDFLKQLKDSLEWSKKTTAAAQTDDTDDDDYTSLFRMKLDKVDHASDAFESVAKQFRDSRNSIHQSRSLKLLNVFAVEDLPEHQKAYKEALTKLGNEQHFWHGTRAANVLSILTKGFFVPPVRGGSVQVTGRMFGDGVYFSNQSTKSLNYASGYWSGQRTNTNCFMFMNDVVMGNEYHPRSSGSMSEAYTGKNSHGAYNSINVKAGTAGVLNHEAIVWNTEQIQVRYLCEFGA